MSHTQPDAPTSFTPAQKSRAIDNMFAEIEAKRGTTG